MNYRIFSISWAIVLLLCAVAQAEVVTSAVEYQDEKGAALKGFLAYDDAVEGKRPGVLVVHEWWGLNEYAKSRTRQLAEMGYVALAADMYGEGKSTTDRAEAAKLSGHLKSGPLLRERARAALARLRNNELVDPDRIAAIGFCFGGTTALELAYGGADLTGVVTFHGGLTVPKPDEYKNMKAAFLILHGAEDPFIKPDVIDIFQKAMIESGVDWRMVFFGGAAHSFSNPEAGDDKSKGSAYDRRTAERAWSYMKLFFSEIFAGR